MNNKKQSKNTGALPCIDNKHHGKSEEFLKNILKTSASHVTITIHAMAVWKDCNGFQYIEVIFLSNSCKYHSQTSLEIAFKLDHDLPHNFAQTGLGSVLPCP